jgi:hypothetical protein
MSTRWCAEARSAHGLVLRCTEVRISPATTVTLFRPTFFNIFRRYTGRDIDGAATAAHDAERFFRRGKASRCMLLQAALARKRSSYSLVTCARSHKKFRWKFAILSECPSGQCFLCENPILPLRIVVNLNGTAGKRFCRGYGRA